MLELEANAIALGQSATNKDDAIEQVGQLLVSTGFMDPAYIDSMRGREAVANTLLGNGIAIPHGLQKDRDYIHRTGIAVLQLPDGVDWKDGEKAHVIVGIAAKSDEHIQILSNLTDALGDEALARELATTDDRTRLLAVLNGETETAIAPELPDFDTTVRVTYPAGHGLHARPATTFVEQADTFKSDIRVRNGDRSADATSMSGLLRLGITGGSELVISARGDDADQALQALSELVETGLNDDDEEGAPVTLSDRQYEGDQIKGVAAAPGIAVGPLTIWKGTEVELLDTAGEQAEELQRLQSGIQDALAELDATIKLAEQDNRKEALGIFKAHKGLLSDPDLQARAEERLTRGVAASEAWWHTIQAEAEALRDLEDERLAGRASDMEDIGLRVLRQISPASVKNQTLALQEPGILVAHDLTPTETAALDKDRVLGIVTAMGGPTSHTAILARALGIPALVGTDSKVLSLQSDRAVLDGAAGLLVHQPTEPDLVLADQVRQAAEQHRAMAFASRFEPALTTDSVRIEVVGNIGSAEEAEEAVEHGAEGVGLLRTEFLFLGRNDAPSEEEQYQTYKAMIQSLNGFPLIIRTLDIGGDKQVPYLDLPKEDNPFLGVRGIRLCLRETELFRAQLRAIYRASKHGPVKIMFPMVGLLEELRDARAMAESVRKEVGADPVDLGMMIEVPSAVALADAFAQEADFFSIGTNDLTQYTLAMDRMHPALAGQADGLHPAVLNMIHQTCEAAQRNQIWVGVCGGVAAEPLAARILIGLGVTELSMNAAAVPEIKLALREASLVACQSLAQRALGCRTASEVHALTTDSAEASA